MPFQRRSLAAAKAQETIRKIAEIDAPKAVGYSELFAATKRAFSYFDSGFARSV